MALNMRTGKLADVAGLDHVNIRTNDVDACRRFYVDALGFEEGYRPDFDFPGLWLYLDGAPVIHVIEVTEPVSRHGGSIDHVAFRAHNFDKFTARLESKGIEYEDRAIPGMDLHQLFCFDPHGLKVEFNFEGRDRPWATIEKEHKALKGAAAGARTAKEKSPRTLPASVKKLATAADKIRALARKDWRTSDIARALGVTYHYAYKTRKRATRTYKPC